MLRLYKLSDSVDAIRHWSNRWTTSCQRAYRSRPSGVVGCNQTTFDWLSIYSTNGLVEGGLHDHWAGASRGVLGAISAA